MAVNPVRNSSGALNPVRDLSLNGINPALRGGTPHGAEPGIILKSNPAAEERSIISNGVKKVAKKVAKKGVGKGDVYQCSVCGLAVTVDEVCGCVDTCDIICCEKPMKPKKRA